MHELEYGGRWTVDDDGDIRVEASFNPAIKPDELRQMLRAVEAQQDAPQASEPSSKAQRIAYFATLLAAGSGSPEHGRFVEEITEREAEKFVRSAALIHDAAVKAVDSNE